MERSLRFRFARVVEGGEEQTMQTSGYAVGDVVYQDFAIRGSNILWYRQGNGFDIPEENLEEIDLPDLDPLYYVMIICRLYGLSWNDYKPFLDIYSEVMPYEKNWDTIRDFDRVAKKFSATQIRRMCSAVTGIDIPNPITLLRLDGNFEDTKVCGKPSTIAHYPAQEAFQSLPTIDGASYFKLTKLLDNRGYPLYLETK